jgi:arylsulfatase A-like enzyme
MRLWLLVASALLVLVGCASTRDHAASGSPPPNLVLVTVDSLRTDRLRLWNRDDGVVTPNLERLAARGALLRNAWATAPWTAPSLVSIFTGLYPPSHGVVMRDDTTSPELPTLARLLAQRGYRLGNFSFFSGISYFRNLGLPECQPGLHHGQVARVLRQWLDNEDVVPEPFFAWLHLIEPHLPYGASGYRARSVTVVGSSGLERAQLRADVPVGSVQLEASDRQALLELYDRDLVAMDKTLGKVLQLLKRRRLLARTVVVVVGDHGEELMEYGWVGHASTAQEAKLVPEILHIPLVMAGPGIPAGAVSDALVQQVDLLPTLCRLLDLPTPDPVDGRPVRMRRQRLTSSRRTVFFDTTVGGNMTSVERAHERLQGAGDGSCLVTRLLPAGDLPAVEQPACRPRQRRKLDSRLERWQQRQGRQRLALLQDLGSQTAPDPIAVATYTEVPMKVGPSDGSRLGWSDSAGQIALSWEVGEDEPAEGGAWIEYRVGRGVLQVTGAFAMEHNRIVFGPFPEGFWNDLADHNPFRYRVLWPEREERSPWTEFWLVPVG